MAPSRRDGSSTSRPRPSQPSPRSATGSSTSASPGSRSPAPRAPAGLGASAIRELAARHGVRPTKALGQHFLIDPNLARAIAAAAEVGPGDRVAEIGAGFGSLTVALAATGARVLAIEFDRALVQPLREVVEGLQGIEVLEADALHLDWRSTLIGPAWTVCANLPYNVAVPIVLRLLDEVPAARRFVLMVQQEVAARFLAGPGDTHYGPVGLRVARVARTELLRRVPPDVFWPRPAVSSAVVRMDRLDRPAVTVDEASLWAVVDAAFAERRKGIRAALVRMGVHVDGAAAILKACGIDPRARAERLSLEDFARLAEALA